MGFHESPNDQTSKQPENFTPNSSEYGGWITSPTSPHLLLLAVSDSCLLPASFLLADYFLSACFTSLKFSSSFF